MTRKDFCPYVKELANKMGLRDWSFEIVREQPDVDSSGGPSTAAIGCVYGRKMATIKLSDGFLEDATPEEQRQTLCHELAHALFAPMHQFLHDELEGPAFKAYLLLMEYGIDATADAIAPHMPLPSMTEKAD